MPSEGVYYYFGDCLKILLLGVYSESAVHFSTINCFFAVSKLILTGMLTSAFSEIGNMPSSAKVSGR